MSESTTNDQIQQEALSIIDDETIRKIDDIKRHIDFITTSLRASANMQTNQLLVAIQQLTVEEFCLEYCGNTQVFLNQQNKKRMNQDSLGKFRKRKPALETNVDSPPKKARPGQENETTENTEETTQEKQISPLETILKKAKKRVQDDQVIENVEKNIQEESEEKTEKEKQVASPERKEEEYDAGEEENVEPLVVKLTRDGHTYVDIQLEPGKDTEALGCFSIEGLNEEAISKLSETHKSRLCKHIEEIQDKLEILKKNFK